MDGNSSAVVFVSITPQYSEWSSIGPTPSRKTDATSECRESEILINICNLNTADHCNTRRYSPLLVNHSNHDEESVEPCKAVVDVNGCRDDECENKDDTHSVKLICEFSWHMLSGCQVCD